ncbi:hypothetical protein [Filimonas effusa]|uniref:Lipoprotein n=1 Tax=Filimonas effusa TaxID=2508721 RepID=A0A4Q1DE59_9BACT|nr:hypothetical protein [Filimonas effusa]RXK86879.1 hypothetical protein ESB13_08845 [Filimonas effusa]
MNIKNICLILSLFLFSCSSSKYYECKYDSPVVVYDNVQLSKSVCTIPAGSAFVLGKKVKGRRLVNYMSFSGYTEEFGFAKTKVLPDYKFVSPGVAVSNGVAQSSGHYNNSAVGGTSSSSSSGDVQVKGYYRKNGTYVRPHVRSAPRRH